jgi:hypothetical protein
MPSKYKPKPHDSLGSREGTFAAKVNKVMTTSWQTVEEIQRKAGSIPSKSVRRRLYHGVQIGKYDYERTIRFKIKKAKSK